MIDELYRMAGDTGPEVEEDDELEDEEDEDVEDDEEEDESEEDESVPVEDSIGEMK